VVLDDLMEYWPLTLRQYYQLVAAGVIDNDPKEYGKLSRELAKARLDGVVPWEAIEDRTRSLLTSDGWADRDAFLDAEKDNFLVGYRRDLLQTQKNRLELWIEKDALSRVCHDAALPYCVPVIVARGYSSVSYVHECRKRIEQNTEDGYEGTVVLYFGDLDPSGWNMLPTMMITLQEEMGLGDQVIPKRCALTVEQVNEYNLPHNPDALKVTDTRARKYVKKFGKLAVELDALPPATLQDLVRQSIEAELALPTFQVEQDRETEDRKVLANLKEQVEDFLDDW
jgi:Na+-translocating ferredoxin:NAD+ oxidoreductase RnfG subunit